MTETCLLIIAPGVYARLCEEAFVELLPSLSVLLDDWLIGYSEDCADKYGPVRGIVEEVGLVESFAGGCQIEKGSGVEVREDEEEKVDW